MQEAPEANGTKSKASAVDELMFDHRTVRGMFRQWEAEPEGSNRSAELINDCLNVLESHSKVEEEIFYPECQRIWLAGADLMNHFYDEHAKWDAMIEDIRIQPASARTNKFLALMKDVFDHLREEESTLFKEFENIVSIRESLGLAEQIRERRRDLLSGRGSEGRAA